MDNTVCTRLFSRGEQGKDKLDKGKITVLEEKGGIVTSCYISRQGI